MNTPLGFFAWLREGVRRAVLLGFSDAIAEVGNRHENEDLSPQLASHLQQSLTLDIGERQAVLAGATAPGARKRLGKGLEQMQAPTKTS
ncbi:MAG: hypothetical protein SFX18_04845 [Pirellulales bacterium]|nr:hypothetical protein [Pirellulales bacterium]